MEEDKVILDSAQQAAEVKKLSEKDSKRKDKKLELMEKRLDSHKEVEKKPAEVFDANDDVNSISATKAVFGDQNGAIAG